MLKVSVIHTVSVIPRAVGFLSFAENTQRVLSNKEKQTQKARKA